MKAQLKILVFVLCLVAQCCYAKTMQVWHQDTIQYKISDDLSAAFQYEARLNVYEQYKLMENHFAPSISWKAFDWLSISPNYRYVLLKKDHHFIKDNRPGIDFMLSYKINDFVLSNRSRFILRKTEHKSPYFRYRNMSKIQYNGFNVFSPYISYEMFFDDGAHDNIYKKHDKVSSHWTTLGISKQLTTNLKADLGYLLIINRNIGHNSFHKPCHVISFGLTFGF